METRDGDRPPDPAPGLVRDPGQDRGSEPQHIDFRSGTFHGPVAGHVIVNGCAPPVPSALSALPAAPAGFAGREAELAVLLDGLRPPDASAPADPPVMWAVTGLGGIGKTALALRAAHLARKRGWFTGGTLFLDLAGYDDTPVTPAHAVTSLLHALGVGGIQLPADEVDQYTLYRSVYRSRLAGLADRGERVLLLLDNVCDPAQLLPLLPGSDLHRVLFTSRESHDSLPARELPLEPMSPGDSAALVARALRLRDPDDDRPLREAGSVDELAGLCGHLPLALQIAAALLRRRRPRRPVASLVEELRTCADRTDALSSRGVDQYGRTLALAPVFEVSLRRLAPDRARALCLLAQVPCVDYGTDTAAVVTGLDGSAVLDVLDDLASAHLVTGERLADDLPERWRIHDLVRDYAAARAAGDPRLAAAGRESRSRARRHFHALAADADRRLQVRTHDPLPRTLADQAAALAWFDTERANLVAAPQWPAEGDADVCVGIALHLAEYLRWRRYFEDWVTVSRTARDIAHRLRDRSAEATVCNNLGGALLRAQRPDEALEPLDRAARLYHLIEDAAGEGTAWNNLGLAQRRSGRVEQALANHLRARDRFRATGYASLEGRAWHNCGLALAAADRHAEAAAAFEQACALHRTTDHVLYGDSLNSLGCALHRTGRTAEALTALRGSVRIREKYDNWYATGQTWNNLALALRTAGLDDEAARARECAAEACARAGISVEIYGHHE
ncbi:tetratricopeptide repeat protein [Streptomyces adustus]|uniref:tetratricopeptide repeat protein n=1 Tax=Streptomyces adustus TaxID=1609272 RepID=UPI0037161E60